MTVTPSIGRIVQYRLNEFDVEQIKRNRQSPAVWVSSAGFSAHTGNDVAVGDAFPAMIVRAWGSEPGSAVNLKVFLDGNDTFWATSRTEGVEPGQWVAVLA